MKKILETEFDKIKNGDWLIAIDKEDNSRYDIYMNIRILKDEKFICDFTPNVKTEDSIQKLSNFFKDLEHDRYDFFILNKEEIKKRKAELMLRELKK